MGSPAEVCSEAENAKHAEHAEKQKQRKMLENEGLIIVHREIDHSLNTALIIACNVYNSVIVKKYKNAEKNAQKHRRKKS